MIYIITHSFKCTLYPERIHLEPTKFSAETHICLLFFLFKMSTELKVSLALWAHAATAASATIVAPSAFQFACARYCGRFTVSILQLRSLPMGCLIFPTLKHVCYCDKLVSHSYHNVCHFFSLYKGMKPEFVIYRVSQEEWTKLRESVPYVELYRYNPKHLYPKLNGYGDNGQRSLKL